MTDKTRAQEIRKPDTDGLSFEVDISRRSYQSERVAWVIAGGAFVIAGLAVIAVCMMLPLKQTVPYYIYVDKETGATQAVVLNDPQTISSNEAVSRHWLSRYIQARERYMYRLQQEDFNFVMATSGDGVGREYAVQYEEPHNKATRLKESLEERIVILSVQLTPGVTGRGTVRYQKIVWKQGQREPDSTTTYVADVAFDWRSTHGWGTNDLLLNPMGFAVVGYRATQEMPAR
jgi:type IV secretion system protein VirB8